MLALACSLLAASSWVSADETYTLKSYGDDDGQLYETVFSKPDDFDPSSSKPWSSEECVWKRTSSDFPDPVGEVFGPGVLTYTSLDWDMLSGWQIVLGATHGQVYGSAVAKDEIDAGGASGSATRDGGGQVILERVDENACKSKFVGSLKPKFRIHTDILNAASLGDETVSAQARTIITIPALDMQADLSGSIDQDEDGSTGLEITIGAGGVETTLPLPASSSLERTEQFVWALSSKEKNNLMSVTVDFQSHVDMACAADGWTLFPFWDLSAVEGMVYGSFAGVLIEGKCQKPNSSPLDCTIDMSAESSWY